MRHSRLCLSVDQCCYASWDSNSTRFHGAACSTTGGRRQVFIYYRLQILVILQFVEKTYTLHPWLFHYCCHSALVSSLWGPVMWASCAWAPHLFTGDFPRESLSLGLYPGENCFNFFHFYYKNILIILHFLKFKPQPVLKL